MISSKNEVVDICITKRLQVSIKRLKRGRIAEIIVEMKLRNDLTEDTVRNKALIHQRIK